MSGETATKWNTFIHRKKNQNLVLKYIQYNLRYIKWII